MLSEAQILERLHKICRDLPGASETVTFGHPTFQGNGKTFSVLEEYKSELGICVKLRRNYKLFSLPIRAFFPRPTSGSTADFPEGACRAAHLDRNQSSCARQLWARRCYRLEIKRSNKTETESFGDITGTF
jgi:hypothetical protein